VIRSRRRRGRAAPASLLVLAAALLSCMSARVPTAAGGMTASKPVIVWSACRDGFQCGDLTVPVDYSKPDGPSLTLSVIRAPARRSRSRLGSLVVNPGGPGVPALDFLRQLAGALPSAVRDRFDLVSFDPRGVGASSSVHCVDDLDPLFAQDFDPSTDAERSALVDAFRTVVAGCQAHDAGLLAHVSTADTARDVDQLREALGVRRITYLGYSYGSYLGTLYASLFPTHVRAMVLDGPVDPTLDAAAATLQQATGFERALDDFLADCSQRTSCAFHHGGASAAAYDTLRMRVHTDPIAGRGRSAGRQLNVSLFDAAVVQALYGGSPAWPDLAAALESARRGDPSPMLDLADDFTGRIGSGRYDDSLDDFWAVGCLDGPPVADIAAAFAITARATAAAPRLGAFIANNGLACAVWPVPVVTAPVPLTAAGAPTVLVVATAHDPATPLVAGEALAAELHARLLVAPGEQHTAFASAGNACVDRTVTNYLVDRRLPGEGTRC
jgi:pimeloyl-ACP methyl ester carboxylesterase